MIPYFKIVDRKEVFGSEDIGTNTVILLITNTDKQLKPLPDASTEDKQQFSDLRETITKNSDFTEVEEGYFEYNRVLTENGTKYLLEDLGLNEYD